MGKTIRMKLFGDGHVEEIITETALSADATAGERVAQQLAARAVQNLADSEPSGDTIEAQDRLKGTPQESLFCISAAELENVIAVTISNALYDGELAASSAPTACAECARRERQLDEQIADKHRILREYEARVQEVQTNRDTLEAECARLREVLRAIDVIVRERPDDFSLLELARFHGQRLDEIGSLTLAALQEG